MALLFCGALLAIAALNVAVDPYEALRLVRTGLAKEPVSSVLNQRLWKMAGFEASPSPRIVLGDSRCDRLRAEYFAEAGAPPTFNLSFGGGTLRESLDALDWASARMPLESVLLCVPFDAFSDGRESSQLVPQSAQLLARPVGYALSPFVTKSSAAVLWLAGTGRVWRTERPDMSREAFWEHQLGPQVIGSAYRSWRAPDALFAQLAEHAAQLARAGTRLTLVVPPTHVDLQQTVDTYGLRAQYEAFKPRLASLAPVVDFDIANDATRDRERWDDPYHPRADVSRAVVLDLVRGTRRLGREIRPSTDPGAVVSPGG